MEKKLTKYFWIIILVTLAIIAFFMAEGTNELVAGTVIKIMPPPAPSVNVKVKTETTSITNSSISQSANLILTRNIFNSTAEEDDGLDEGLPEDLPIADGELPVVQCDIPGIKLLALISASGDPEWSFANIEMDGQKDLYRINDPIKDRVVSDVGWRYLMLKGSRDECYIDMYDQNPIKPRTAAKPAPADAGKGIAVNGEYERTVDRAIVDQALANPAKFAQAVRVRPYKKDGKVVGFRMRRVQKGSPIEQLGAQRGDILHSVNGIELKSVDDALTAYQKLRSDDQLVFSITRGGKPVDLKINIQ
ncbi:MAG: PDZ domain-containing protein [Deltaproteobacteria bacterium]|nr:PDZ domain-containing protein [Deltaproteobacteria bacterium]